MVSLARERPSKSRSRSPHRPDNFFPPVTDRSRLATKKVGAKSKRRATAPARKESRGQPRRSTARRPEPPAGQRPFIVGIGASAGGLHALETFFDRMPSDSGMAFVVVTHLAPDRPSLLPELLQRRTGMPVKSATDRCMVEANHVYVSAPGMNLGLLNRTLHWMDPVPGRQPHQPIDYFFRSLARDQEDRAICVVLSGTGTDGTLGLRAIKAHAGMVMVQDESSADYSGMPHSAAATLLADYVLPPDQMPARLIAYAQAADKLAPAGAQAGGQLEVALPKIYLLLRNRLGHDFSGYKQSTMQRRIERRMRVHQLERPIDYLSLLQSEPHELDLVFQELLITVTQFFRDPEAFDALAGQLAGAIDRGSRDAPVRVWVPGCSTGEEPYSIAMLATEIAERAGKPLQLQIFATDLDSSAVETARAGHYPAGILVDVGAARLQRHFVATGNGYRITKAVRDRVIFANHNLLRDPPFTKLDLLACRNLLIYLNAELQHRLFPMFHYALEPGALLWLGTSESATGHTELFTATDRKWKIYQRRPSPLGTAPFFDRRPNLRIEQSSPQPLLPRPAATASVSHTMEGILLERFVPPSLFVSERGDIAYIYGRTGLYLEPSAGEPRHNAFVMAREGLRLCLQSAVRLAMAEEREVAHHGIAFRSNGGFESVSVIARRIVEPEALRGLVRVSFVAAPAASAAGKSAAAPSKRGGGKALPRIEKELKSVRDSWQGTLDELQNSNEELKSANEEMQSTNEELQSMNEELESSKEELQSLNEELQTVNSELQEKIEELAQLNDDMQNMLNATDIATVFLDRELRIKRFTEQARRVVRLIATDVGRPIGDLVSKIRYETLTRDAEQVLRTLLPHELEVQSLDGRWLLVRMLPYRTGHNMIDGVVITFVDIDRVKGAEVLAASRAFAESIVQTVREPLLVLDDELRIVASNVAFSRLVSLGQTELQGRTLRQLGTDERSFARLGEQLEAVITCGARVDAFELTNEFDFVVRHRFQLYARRLVDVGAGALSHILVVLETDVREPVTSQT
jgi:two-component system CheB/CheR fusion protein